MKRLYLLICFVVCALLGASVFSEIYNGDEEPVINSGPEKVQSSEQLTKSLAQAENEDEVSTVSSDSVIANLSAQIQSLEDKNLEPELQRQVEQLKLQSEISRLNQELTKARQRGDAKQIQEYSAEIEHLSGINEPVIGDENEQPEP